MHSLSQATTSSVPVCLTKDQVTLKDRFRETLEVYLVNESLLCKGQEAWGLSGLRCLALVNCGLGVRCWQLAEVLRTSPGLEELNLARNSLGSGVEMLISPLLELSLKRLSLASTGLSTQVAIALIPGFTVLTLLDVSNNGLEDAFIQVLVNSWPLALTHLHLAYSRLTDLSRERLLPVVSKLTSLDLSHNPMTLTTPFPFLPVLRLRGLHVSCSMDCEELSSGWSSLDGEFGERLKALDCPAALLSPRTISSIRLCTRLQSLNLTACSLGPAVEAVSQLQNLRELRLATNRMDAVCVRRVLEGLSKCSDLRVLDLSDNPARGWDISALLPVATLEMLLLTSIALPDGLTAFLSVQRSLFLLNLSRSGLNSSKLSGIVTALKGIPLSELCISGNDLSQPLTSLQQMFSLKRLEVADCCINADSLRAISALLPPTFTHFDLFNNPIGPCVFPVLPALTCLNLHKCQLHDLGIERIGPSLSLCPHLQEVQLGWNCLTAACTPLLVLPAGLHHLSLFENSLDDDRALCLVNSLPSTLRSLDLGYTQLTTKVVKALLERLPALEHLQWCNLVGQTLHPEVLSALPQCPLVIVNQ